MILVSLCSAITGSNGQGIVNDGGSIYITGNASVTVTSGGGNFRNQQNGFLAITGASATLTVAGNFVNQNTASSDNAGTISVGGNWINNSANNVFTSNNGTVVLNGNNQTIGGSATTWFNNLTVQGTGTKTLNVNTLVGGGFAAPSGILNLTNRPLDLNLYQLTVTNPLPAAINTLSGYIISDETVTGNNTGIVQWNIGANTALHTIPFGTAAGISIPFSITKLAGNANVSVSTRKTNTSNNALWQPSVTNMYSTIVGGPGEIPVVIDRWWDINPSSPITATVSFTYEGSENTTTWAPTGVFAAQNWNGILWLPSVGSGAGVLAGTSSVTAAAISINPSSTPWVLSNIIAPLPVELLNFGAECFEKNKAKISWSTTSESETDYFIVERSADGIHFSELARKKAAGSSNVLRTYEILDNHINSGVVYYKLSDIDFNGNRNEHPVISVSNCFTGNISLNYAESDNELLFSITGYAPGDYFFEIYDCMGRIICATHTRLSETTSSLSIENSIAGSGIYHARIISANETAYTKFLKK